VCHACINVNTQINGYDKATQNHFTEEFSSNPDYTQMQLSGNPKNID